MGIETLRYRHAAEDVGDRAQPRAARRDAEHLEQQQHPDPGRDPVDDGVDAERRRKRQAREQDPPRIERAHVRVGRERPAPGDLRRPHGQLARRPRVVHRLLHRDVVGDEVAPGEHAREEQRVRVDHGHERREEKAGRERTQPAAQEASARRRPSRIAAARTKSSGADPRQSETGDPLAPLDAMLSGRKQQRREGELRRDRFHLPAVHLDVAVVPEGPQHEEPGGRGRGCGEEEPLRDCARGPARHRPRPAPEPERPVSSTTSSRASGRQALERGDRVGRLAPSRHQARVGQSRGVLVPFLEGVAAEAGEARQRILPPVADGVAQAERREEGRARRIARRKRGDAPQAFHAGQVAAVEVGVEDGPPRPERRRVKVPGPPRVRDAVRIRAARGVLELRGRAVPRRVHRPKLGAGVPARDRAGERGRCEHGVVRIGEGDAARREQRKDREDRRGRAPPRARPGSQDRQGTESRHPADARLGQRGRRLLRRPKRPGGPGAERRGERADGRRRKRRARGEHRQDRGGPEGQARAASRRRRDPVEPEARLQRDGEDEADDQLLGVAQGDRRRHRAQRRGRERPGGRQRRAQAGQRRAEAAAPPAAAGGERDHGERAAIEGREEATHHARSPVARGLEGPRVAERIRHGELEQAPGRQGERQGFSDGQPRDRALRLRHQQRRGADLRRREQQGERHAPRQRLRGPPAIGSPDLEQEPGGGRDQRHGDRDRVAPEQHQPVDDADAERPACPRCGTGERAPTAPTAAAPRRPGEEGRKPPTPSRPRRRTFPRRSIRPRARRRARRRVPSFPSRRAPSARPETGASPGERRPATAAAAADRTPPRSDSARAAGPPTRRRSTPEGGRAPTHRAWPSRAACRTAAGRGRRSCAAGKEDRRKPPRRAGRRAGREATAVEPASSTKAAVPPGLG